MAPNSKKMKSYGLGVREVIMVDCDVRKIEYKSYDTIVDAINVWDTYRMVPVKEVTRSYSKLMFTSPCFSVK